MFVGSSKGTDVSLDPAERPEGPHALGLYRLAARWRAGLEDRRRGGSRAHQPRLRADGRGPQARRAERDPARRTRRLRAPTAGRSLRSVSVLHPVADRGGEDRAQRVCSSAPCRRAHAEAGGEKGVEALQRLEKVFGRVQSPWMPASGDETYEIIRRRLFQTLDSDGETRARRDDQGVPRPLQERNAAEFPPEARESRYYDLLRMSYPIHPELFDRLSKDWASLPNFQRTRGVLRFMANVVGVLWHQRVARPADHAGPRADCERAHPRERALSARSAASRRWSIRKSTATGRCRPRSRPIHRVAFRRCGRRRAPRARCSSAPRRLSVARMPAYRTPACAWPAPSPAISLPFSARRLRELSQRATYLYEEAGRYWFSTQPTLNRARRGSRQGAARPRRRRRHLEGSERGCRGKGGFHRVFAAPDDPTTIDEASALSLVDPRPVDPSLGQGRRRRARRPTAVSDALTRCRASQRRFRNTLIFVAADEALLATAREAMRRSMAWADIAGDERLQQQLTQAQAADAKDKAKTSQRRRAAGRAERLEPYPLPGEDRRDGSRQGVRSGPSGAEREGQGQRYRPASTRRRAATAS